MEFDPAAVINQLGAGALVWLAIAFQIRALRQDVLALQRKIDNGLSAKVNAAVAKVERLPCIKGTTCPTPPGEHPEVSDAA